MHCEYLIVGSGLTGAVIARELADAGRSVLVLERRPHTGGNVRDHVHPCGIRMNAHGPHYFRTNDEGLWEYVHRFARFDPHEPVLKTWVDGRHEDWPVTTDYIRRIAGDRWEPAFRGEPRNFEEASLAMMPRAIYEKFVKGYTEKQWGVPAASLSASLARRFEVRDDAAPHPGRRRFQGIPEQGYAALMARMLEGIPVVLNCDYLKHRGDFTARKLTVFTGPIDEYFGFDLGRLAYRGQRRAHEYLPDAGYAQPCGQVNNPDPANGPHVRTIEWKHLMPRPFAERIRGTVLTRETTFTPDNPDEYEYPFPDEPNARLCRTYRARADALPGLLVRGRLGEYRYYDMDQAIARARVLARRVLDA